MNHFCTYFDSGFLLQGLAAIDSILLHHGEAWVWVLTLDDEAMTALASLGRERVRLVSLGELESFDSELLGVRGTRTRIEYYFTLSPCWPLYILSIDPSVRSVTYVDADMLFHQSLDPLLGKWESAQASVHITSHRFPEYIREHYERHGRYNVGILSFRNDDMGVAVLKDWRARCLEWCCDELQEDRYADQKYLDRWPLDFPTGVCVDETPGLNLAPWNWRTHRVEANTVMGIRVDDAPLLLYHYARFKPLRGAWKWQSGQLDYGVMPYGIRNAIYSPYYSALIRARDELVERGIRVALKGRSLRKGRAAWRQWILKTAFGSDWLRIGSRFFSLGLLPGRYSGAFLARLRVAFRK